jgi:MFS transporter, SP family, sugar:H+ symporter
LECLWPSGAYYSGTEPPVQISFNFLPNNTPSYDTGTISGIIGMQYWQQEFADPGKDSVTSSQESLIVSILSAGTFFGALAAAPVADLMGRRLGLMFSAGLVFNLGVILQTAATEQDLFVAGRFFAGLGVGLVSAISMSSCPPLNIVQRAANVPILVPMYQSETSPRWIRGTIVGCYQLAITIGLFLAAIVNNATKSRNDSGSYRIPVAVQFAWSIILVTGYEESFVAEGCKRGANVLAA